MIKWDVKFVYHGQDHMNHKCLVFIHQQLY